MRGRDAFTDFASDVVYFGGKRAVLCLFHHCWMQQSNSVVGKVPANNVQHF